LQNSWRKHTQTTNLHIRKTALCLAMLAVYGPYDMYGTDRASAPTTKPQSSKFTTLSQ
jgi:hypothetical protein